MKEKIRHCLHCGKAFTGKRGDSKYCTDTCRGQAWQAKKGKGSLGNVTLKKEATLNNPKEKLFSDIDELGDFLNTTEENSDNFSLSKTQNKPDPKNNAQNNEEPEPEEQSKYVPEEYILAKKEVDNEAYTLCAARLNSCRKDILEWEKKISWLEEFINDRVKRPFIPDLDFSKVYESTVTRRVEKERAERARIECYKVLDKIKEEEKYLSNELLHHPAKIIIEERVKNPVYSFYKAIAQNRRKDQEEQESKSLMESENSNLSEEDEEQNNFTSDEMNEEDDNIMEDKTPPENNITSDKIKSAADLSKVKAKVLNFSGKWFDFLKKPQTNFMCIVHGSSGHGKSHFCMQFAKYLAENFGNVLYISGEEGFSHSFLDKVRVTGADKAKRLYFIELKHGTDIIHEIPNKFHFIFIDSLTSLDIEIDLLKEIRAHYPQSGIVGICQNTKGKTMRGSSRIIHEGDIAIEVERGVATTTKNRFHEIFKEFNVWNVYKKPSSKKPKNDLDEDLENTVT